MKKKSKRFAVFILSHGRAENQDTYDWLKKSGYTGDIKIIVDNLDDQLELYQEKYGSDVIVFDKKEALSFSDTMTNTNKMLSPLFARNITDRIAQKEGYQYHSQFDDDLFGFCCKYYDGSALKTSKISNMDAVIDLMLDYMDESNIDSFGMCNTGILFGGVDGVYQKGIGWNFNQSVIIRTGSGIKFYGLTNQDTNALLFHGRTGKLMFETYFICHAAPKRSTNKGGLHDLYADIGDYTRSFTSVMICPDVVKIDSNMNIRVDRKNSFPKILNDRWCKHG